MNILNHANKLLTVALISSGLIMSWNYINQNPILGFAPDATSTAYAPAPTSNTSYTPAYTLAHISTYIGSYTAKAVKDARSTIRTNTPAPVPAAANNVAQTSTASQTEATSTSTDSVWNNISQALTMDHKTDSAQVQKQIRLLLSDKTELNRILTQATPYLYFIYNQTETRGLPAELALIPFIESEFNPNDKSSVGATGLWQLMPKTAQELGVQVKPNYDGRRDVIASTKAALAYFKDLGNYFKGNWYLAIAAYNCGQGKIQNAMKKAGSQSFWNLSVPKETQLYVPKLLAIAAIVKDPAKYGVQLPHIDNQPYFAQVQTTKPVDLSQVAQKTGVDIKTINKLNPDYNHGMVAKKGAYTVLIPANKAPQIQAQLA